MMTIAVNIYSDLERVVKLLDKPVKLQRELIRR